MRIDSLLLVIDPQRGFTSPEGTLGRAYGKEELVPIRNAVERLAARLPILAQTARTAVVTSAYRPGQFDPAPNSSLFRLGVPGPSRDDEIDEALAGFPFDHRFVKTEKNALSDPAFRAWVVTEQEQGARRFLLCGFLLEHCVSETALALRNLLPSSSQVVVLADLAASRAAKYGPEGAVEQALRRLRAASVEIVSGEEAAPPMRPSVRLV